MLEIIKVSISERIISLFGSVAKLTDSALTVVRQPQKLDKKGMVRKDGD